MFPFFWLQLWVTPLSLASEVAPRYASLPLWYALMDCDSLLRHAGLRDTVAFLGEGGGGYFSQELSKSLGSMGIGVFPGRSQFR